MSEFELIAQSPSEPGRHLQVAHRTVVGDADIPVLWMSVNPTERAPAWPTVEDIPGLKLLTKSSKDDRFEVEQKGEVTQVSWNGRVFLKSCHQPFLFPVDLSVLPGLKARSGDTLPAGFQEAIRWDWQIDDVQNFYGLGERSMPLDRRGAAPVNWTTDDPSGHHRTTDPLYQAHPLLWGRTEGVWWAVFLVHSPYTRFDLGQNRHDRMRWLSLGASLEFQVHAGATPTDLHASLRQVIENPTAAPLWSFGFHQSRWGYRTGHEVEQLVDSFEQKKIPLDVVHLDIDHMENYRSFTFSEERFPDPKGMFAGFAERGVRTVTIIDPGLRFDPGNGYQALDEGLSGNHFLKSTTGAPVVGYCWPDEALFPDFSRESAREWWAKHAAYYLDNGVSGLWIDMNEPAIFDKPFWTGGSKQQPMPLSTPCGEDDRRFNQAALHNLYGSQMAEATSNSWKPRNERPWVLTRAGFTGVTRYAWSWMGDNTSWWEHLAMSLPQLASMGLVGSPFVGVDIGGFLGHCTPELYSAWIEASVIYPFMRAHSALGTRVQHPWSFGPEVEEVARTAIRFRYRLLPYLYASAMAQTEGSVPLFRPQFFDYPDDPRFPTLEDQVMVGPHLLAAPFLVRGQSERLVQLPQGVWYDLHSGRRYEGGSSITITRRPGLVPLFAKAGAVIPMLASDHQVTHTDQMGNQPWQLYVCPGLDSLESIFYWDDGDGWDFTMGRFLRAVVTLEGKTPIAKVSQGNADFPRPRVSVVTPGEAGWEIASETSWKTTFG